MMISQLLWKTCTEWSSLITMLTTGRGHCASLNDQKFAAAAMNYRLTTNAPTSCGRWTVDARHKECDYNRCDVFLIILLYCYTVHFYNLLFVLLVNHFVMCVVCVVTDLGRAERPSQQQWVGVAPHDTPAFEQLIRRSPEVIAVFCNHYGKCWGTECRSHVINNRQRRSFERPEVLHCHHELSTDHKGCNIRWTHVVCFI